MAFKLQTIQPGEKHTSRARLFFNENYGNFFERQFDVKRPVIDDVRGLYNRAEYTPYFNVIQFKGNENNRFFFSERIFSNNPSLNNLEKRFRKLIVGVKAVNFEEIPLGYRHFFKSPWTGIPCNMGRTTATIGTGMGRVSISKDRIKSIDYRDSCTLKMVPPEPFEKILEELENTCSYMVSVGHFVGRQTWKDEELLLLESHLNRNFHFFLESE
jgi:hypothetical protein